MKQKTIIGLFLVVAGIGGLSYVYNLYIKDTNLEQ